MNRDRILAATVAVSVVASAVLVAAVPVEVRLGQLLKLVLFHGASTWVDLIAFTLQALLGVAFLVSGRSSLYSWARTLRYMTPVWWAANTVMGIVSMRLAWGGFVWGEPRMRMTLWILVASFILLGLDQFVERRRLLAAGDVAIGILLWSLVFASPKVMHPDNPVFASGGTMIGLFVGMVVVMLLGGSAFAMLLQRRLSSPKESAA